MEEYSIKLTSFRYEGDSERLSDWLKGTELYVALWSRKILASMHLFKTLFSLTRLGFIAAKITRADAPVELLSVCKLQ